VIITAYLRRGLLSDKNFQAGKRESEGITLPVYYYPGIQLGEYLGKFVFQIVDLNDEIPEGLMQYVDEIRVHTQRLSQPWIEEGFYKNGNIAVQVFWSADERGEPYQDITVSGKSMEEVNATLHELYEEKIVPSLKRGKKEKKEGDGGTVVAIKRQ